jgi:hypothetical protein
MHKAIPPSKAKLCNWVNNPWLKKALGFKLINPWAVNPLVVKNRPQRDTRWWVFGLGKPGHTRRYQGQHSPQE